MSANASTPISSTAGGELHQPPRGWAEVPLSTVADVRFSGVDKVSRPSEDPVRLCNYVDVYKNEYITPDLEFMRATATTSEIERFRLELGDVIITKDSETPDDIGVPTIVDYVAPDLVCGYHLALIRPNKDEVDPTFLGKQLAHHRHARRFGQLANGLTRYGLPISAVSNAPIWRPKLLSEQQDVGRILRLADEAIEKTEAVIAKLRQIRLGLLHGLLTCGLDKNGQLRDFVAKPEQFQDSPIGRIPRDWAVRRLSDVADISSGVTLGRNLQGFGTVELPYLRVANVQDGFLDLSEVKTVRVLEHEVERFLLRPGDVLMNEGGDFDKLGRGTVWEGQISQCLHQNHVFKVRPHADKLLPQFLAAVSGSSFGKRYFLSSSKQSTNLASINSTQLKAFSLPCPTRIEQERICEAINRSDDRLKQEEITLAKTQGLRFGLAIDLLTGRVRVPPSNGGAA